MTDNYDAATYAGKTVFFEGSELRVIRYRGEYWISSADLSRSLGYTKSCWGSQMYNRNKDAFDSDSTAVVSLKASEYSDPASLTNEHLCVNARIFTLKGCAMLAAYSRLPKASVFRRWVMDLLDSVNGEAND